MEEIGDMIEQDLDVEAARNIDGQFYFDPKVPLLYSLHIT